MTGDHEEDVHAERDRYLGSWSPMAWSLGGRRYTRAGRVLVAIVAAFVIVAAAAGYVAGGGLDDDGPACPEESSCRADYADGTWSVEEVPGR
jgi:hypothetical protein